jgi:hypothetical protein
MREREREREKRRNNIMQRLEEWYTRGDTKTSSDVTVECWKTWVVRCWVAYSSHYLVFHALRCKKTPCYQIGPDTFRKHHDWRKLEKAAKTPDQQRSRQSGSELCFIWYHITATFDELCGRETHLELQDPRVDWWLEEQSDKRQDKWLGGASHVKLSVVCGKTLISQPYLTSSDSPWWIAIVFYKPHWTFFLIDEGKFLVASFSISLTPTINTMNETRIDGKLDLWGEE